jgi:hypothetical protein
MLKLIEYRKQVNSQTWSFFNTDVLLKPTMIQITNQGVRQICNDKIQLGSLCLIWS